MNQAIKFFEQANGGSNVGYSLESVLIHFTVTLLLSLFIYVIYRATYSGVAYSKSFNLSIVLTALVTAMVMMVIGSNLALSLGMVGALSIVRFRSAVKEAKDIGFIFWGIGIGLSAGTGSIEIALIGSAFIGAVMLVSKFGASHDSHYLLILRGLNFEEEKLKLALKPLVKRFKLKTRMSSPQSSEIIFEVSLMKNKENLVEVAMTWDGVEMANLVAYNGEIS